MIFNTVNVILFFSLWVQQLLSASLFTFYIILRNLRFSQALTFTRLHKLSRGAFASFVANGGGSVCSTFAFIQGHFRNEYVKTGSRNGVAVGIRSALLYSNWIVIREGLR